MSAVDFLTAVGDGLIQAIDPLRRALKAPAELDALLRRAGWRPPLEGDYFTGLSTALSIGGDVDRVVATLEALADDDRSIDEVVGALNASAKLLTDLSRVARPAGAALPTPLDRADFWVSFPVDLAQDLVISYIEKAHPALFAPLHLFGALDEQVVQPPAADLARLPYLKRRLRWDRLATIVSDPALLARDVYGWGAAFDTGKLLLRLETAFRALGIIAARHVPTGPLVRHYYPADPPDDLRLLQVTFLREQRRAGAVEAGLAIVPIAPPTGGSPHGLFVGPIVEGTAGTEIALDGPYSLTLAGGMESTGVAGIELRPGKMAARLDSAPGILAMSGTLAAKPSRSWILVGAEDGDHVELDDFAIGLELAGPATDPEFILRLHTGGLRLIIDLSEGDSFLQRVFGTDPQKIEVNGDLVWSSKRGLRFDGQAGLHLTVPLNRSFGPTHVTRLDVGFDVKGQTVALSAGVTGSAQVGPVTASVENMGLSFSLNPVAPPARGTFGDLDLSFGFKPPTGVGLSLDSSVVQGAGFLAHDPARHMYAGAAMLTVRDRFSIEIVGMLTTQMLDGSDGYSLLLLGIVQFPPIPIGFGFSLNELGALVGINRTADVDALSGALASGDLDVVLFPRSAAALPAVPDALGKLFPPKADAHTIGIIAGFTWGPSALAKIELGVIYDTSAPLRVVTIGRLAIERPQIVLHVLALGIVDFNEGELDLQARLFDSRVLGGDLSGDSALMLRWGRDPDLVLSIGGFHPAYKPPTSFARRFRPLQRVTLRAHTDESVLRLGLNAYLAVTSNTVQMGARVDFGVTVSAFSIDGLVSFDALVQWDPEFYIDVAVRGSVAMKIGGTTLLGASVAAQLVGPGDWFVDGTATLSILWWDIDADFTIGQKRPSPARIPVDGATQLIAALTEARSWGSQAAQQGLVSVRRPHSSTGPLVLHPLDDLTVRQQVAPLGVPIDRIDAGPLVAPRTFDITVNVGSFAAATEALTDPFARAQYVNMSDAAKLAAPSFEPLTSGVRVHLAAGTAAPVVAAGWTYDQFLLTGSGLRSSRAESFVPDAAALTHAITTSAAASAPLRPSVDWRYESQPALAPAASIMAVLA